MASDPPASDTREQILDAAEAVVVREGVRNFTLNAVAAQSGISKGGSFITTGRKKIWQLR